MGQEAFVTFGANDSSALGCVVLAHSLRKHGTLRSLVALVTDNINPKIRTLLSGVFDVVQCVPKLNLNDQRSSEGQCFQEVNVELTKLNCWRLTQFTKCVYLDADTLVLQNCDELFDRAELSATPDIGWPDCFNSGVFVFVPSMHTYWDLVNILRQQGSFDGSDQGVLNSYFGEAWRRDLSKRLPFIYNLVSSTSYTYAPAYQQFGKNAKIVHFVGYPKPWSIPWDSRTGKMQVFTETVYQKQFLQDWLDIFYQNVFPLLPELNLFKSLRGELPLESCNASTCQPAVSSPSKRLDANSPEMHELTLPLTHASNVALLPDFISASRQIHDISSSELDLNPPCLTSAISTAEDVYPCSPSDDCFLSILGHFFDHSVSDKLLPFSSTCTSLFVPHHNYIIAPVYRFQQTEDEPEDKREIRFIEDYIPPEKVFYPAKEHTPIVDDADGASTSHARGPPSPITFRRGFKDEGMVGARGVGAWQRPQEGVLFTPRRAVPVARDETTDDDSLEAKSEMSPVRQAMASRQRRQERAKERLGASAPADDSPVSNETSASRPDTPDTPVSSRLQSAESSQAGSPEMSPPTSKTSSSTNSTASHTSSETASSVNAPAPTPTFIPQAKDSLLLVHHRTIGAKERAALDDDAKKVREAFKAMDAMMAAADDEEEPTGAGATLSPVQQRMLARRQRMAELAKQQMMQQTQEKQLPEQNPEPQPVPNFTSISTGSATEKSDLAKSETALTPASSPIPVNNESSKIGIPNFVKTDDSEVAEEDAVGPSKVRRARREKEVLEGAEELRADSPPASPISHNRARLERKHDRREKVGLVVAASGTGHDSEDNVPSSSGSQVPREKTSQRPRKKDK